MTSYLIENEAENLQNGDAYLAQIPDFEMEYLEKHWRVEVGDGSFFCIFHALSFELNIFFDQRFSLTPISTWGVFHQARGFLPIILEIIK